MLHSRCSNPDVASSKGRMNASTNDMIGRPALKSFFRLSSAYAIGVLGWRRKAQGYRLLKHVLVAKCAIQQSAGLVVFTMPNGSFSFALHAVHNSIVVLGGH